MAVSNRQILIYFLVVLDFSTHEFVVKKNFIGSKAIFCCTGCEKENIPILTKLCEIVALNLTKFGQNRINNKKFLLLGHFL